MADKIVGFSIEIKGQNEVKSTTQLLGLLNTQLILVANTLDVIDKTSGKALGELSKDVKNVSGSVATMGGVVKTSFASFERGNQVVQDLGNGFFDATREIDKTAKSVKGLTQEELVQLEVQRAILREQKQVAKQQAVIQIEGKNNLKSLSAQLSLATIEWRKFTQEELKNTDAGRKAAAEVLRLNKALEEEERKVGKAARGVGFYERATASLGKTLLKLSVGRDIVRGLFNAFTDIVKSGAGTNETFANIIKSFDRLKTFATSLATAFLNLFGGAVTKAIENFTFFVFKTVEAFKAFGQGAADLVGWVNNLIGGFGNLADSGGILGGVFSFIRSSFNAIITLFTEFPAVVGGVIEVLLEFKNIAVRTFSEVSLNIEKAITNIKRFGTAITGGDTKELDKRLNEINKSLASNNIFARGIGQAFEDGFNNAKKAQDEFNKSQDVEAEKLKQQAKNVEDLQAKKDAAAAAEKKQIEELKKDQTQALEDLKANNVARLLLVKELSNELIQAEIENIKDQTSKAIAAEQERFRLEKEARKKNLEQTALDVQAEADNLKKLFGANSEEYIKFVAESGEQLVQVKDISRKQDEQAEQTHQSTLNRIIKEGAEADLEAEKKASDARVKVAEGTFNAIQNAYKKNVSKLTEFIKKNAEETAKTTQAIKDTIVSVLGSAFSAISDITEAANNAENERLDAAIQNRQDSIDNINEQLQEATGLQKKFLQQQLKQEQDALNKETAAKEKAQKEQAETQKGIAIAQALINGALGVTGIWAGVISGNPVVDAVLKAVLTAALVVTTATQVAAISSQKFARGGILEGPSHAQGGIKTPFGELQGGEAVMTVEATNKHRNLLSALNVDGGGVSFANGGILGVPMSAPNIPSQIESANQQVNAYLAASMAMVQATNARIDRFEVIQDLNNLQDIQKNDSKLQVRTTLR